MRTKSLILAAAISAAGLATSMAQVYSVNIVGYVTKVLPGGKLSLIQNPLKGSTNTIAELFKTLPENAQIFRYVPPPAGTGFAVMAVEFGVLGNSAGDERKDLLPGEGVFIRMPAGPDLTLTFVGDVLTGSLTNTVPKGLSIKGSIVPQAGTVVALGFVGAESDTIFKWNLTTQRYDVFTYEFGAWGPSVPSLDVGEAAFFSTVNANVWTRQFTVN